MAMTGAGLDAAREAAINAVPSPANTTAAALAYSKALRLADSTAIVTYIQQYMAVASTGTGNLGAPVISNSTAVT